MITQPSEKTPVSALKLRTRVHNRRPASVSAYMVSNAFGVICGGNLRVFIPFDELRSFDYPTVFRSMSEGRDFVDFDARAEVANRVIDNLYGEK